MNLHTTHRGADQPFERDRYLVLRAIPEGATIASATATARPVSADPGGRFLESIEFDGIEVANGLGEGGGTWGAHQRVVDDSVEVDLRARRRLASVRGTNLATGHLLVDLGGGFSAVDDLGGLGGDSEFILPSNDNELPGLVVTGLRVGGTPSDVNDPPPGIDQLEVASPPSNVTLAVDGGPTFWTHFGDLVAETTSPDFTELLQEALSSAEIEHGHHVIGFVLHSDTVARIDLTLDITYTTTASATPDGVEQMSLEYGFGSTSDSSNGAMSITVPRGSVAVAGSTAGRVQGSFAPTRIVHGPTGRVTVDGTAEVGPSASHAQRFQLQADQLITSVDVMVAAITSTSELSIDLVGDLDGKPDQVSLLASVAERSVSRDEAPDVTWINVPLPGELELLADRHYWLVMHARQGTLNWARSDGATKSASLQATTDGGLSWRAAGDVVEAYFRLRHATPTFNMPLELRVNAGAGEVPVDLSRFESSGAIDFSLDFPEVAEAINSSLDDVGAGMSSAEHLENGDFERWYRSGSDLTPGRALGTFDDRAAGAFSPNGSTIYVATSDRFEAYDTYCLETIYSNEVSLGRPSELIVDPTGRWGLVSSPAVSLNAQSTTPHSGWSATMIDLASGRPLDNPIRGIASLRRFQQTADRSGLYALAEVGELVALTRLSWATIRAATRSGSLVDVAPRWLSLSETTRGFTVGADGNVVVAEIADGGQVVVTGYDSGLQSSVAQNAVPLDGLVAIAPLARPGALALLGESELLVVDATARRVVARHALPTGSGGRALVADEYDGSILVITGDRIMRLRADGRSLSESLTGSTEQSAYMMSPTGNRLLRRRRFSFSEQQQVRIDLVRVGLDLPSEWELTAGEVRPDCGGNPLTALAELGGAFVNDVPVESAMSQVVPVDATVTYRFSFDGVSSVPDAEAQILWRSDDCGADRIDSVPIDVVPRGDSELSPDRPPLRVHERIIQPPPGAVAAEVRFHTHDGVVAIDNVSLAATTDSTSNASLQPTAGEIGGWSGSGSPLAAGTDESGVTTLVAGSGDGALVQVVPVDGPRYELDAVLRVLLGDEAAVVVDFFDGSGTIVGGPSLRIPVSNLTFDQLVARGETPLDAVDARVSLEVPASSSLAVERLALSFIDPVSVSLEIVSEAPGQLTISNPTVGVDIAPPSRPPVPENGLCPPTPPGFEPGEDCHTCYCPCCADQVELVEPTPVATPGNRPADVGTCVECGNPVVVTGTRPGSVIVGLEPRPVVLPSYRVTASAASIERPRKRLVTIDLPITDIRGIGERLASELADRQIRSIAGLARADLATLSDVNGISERQALRFIAQAKRLLKERGTVVL